MSKNTENNTIKKQTVKYLLIDLEQHSNDIPERIKKILNKFFWETLKEKF